MKDVPPNDKDLERCVLGAVFFEREAMRILLNAGVTSDTFYHPQHGLIFKAIDKLYEEGDPIDQLSVTNTLREIGTLEQIGGEGAITSIAGEITSSANIEHHTKKLRVLELRRRVIGVAATIRSLAYDDMGDGNGLLDVMETNIFAMKEDFKPGPRGMTDRIRDFIETTSGNFSTTEANRTLNYITSDNKKKVNVVLSRMVKEGIIERAGDRNGIWRKVEKDCRPIDILNADTSLFPIKWPFGIERYIEIMPRNIIVVAGEPNTGKTAFLLNTVFLNMTGKVPVHFFSSEMGEAELLKRVRLFDTLRPEDWRVNFYERADKFPDIIRPNDINIIDFLEIHDEFWKIGGQLKDIHDRLDKGIAIVAIQKDPQKDFGRGGITTLEKPRLYLSLRYDKEKKSGCCEIIKAKNWATLLNPTGFKIYYKLHHGAQYSYAEWEMP